MAGHYLLEVAHVAGDPQFMYHQAQVTKRCDAVLHQYVAWCSFSPLDPRPPRRRQLAAVPVAAACRWSLPTCRGWRMSA